MNGAPSALDGLHGRAGLCLGVEHDAARNVTGRSMGDGGDHGAVLELFTGDVKACGGSVDGLQER